MHAGTPDKAHLHVYRYSLMFICFSIAQILVHCASNIGRIGAENMEYMCTLNVVSLANVVGTKTEPSCYLPGC